MDPVNADLALRRFFTMNGPLRHPESLLRAERIQAHLRDYLETDAAVHLDAGDHDLVALERQFTARSPYATVLGPRQLLRSLPGFLSPPTLLPDPHDRLAQISVASRLAQWLCSRGLVGLEESRSAVVLVHAAADRARRVPASARATSGADSGPGGIRGNS